MSDDDAQLNEARVLARRKRGEARLLLEDQSKDDPLLAYALFGQALERLKDLARMRSFPALTVDSRTGDDGEQEDWLYCPHCGLEIDGDAADLASVDVSVRWTYGYVDAPSKTITFDYDDNHNEGVGYVHDQCGLPVSLPEGWTEG